MTQPPSHPWLAENLTEITAALFRIAWGHLHDKPRAEDAVQQAVTEALLRQAAFADREHAVRWLAQVVRNKAVDAVRKRQRERPLGDHDQDLPSHASHPPLPSDRMEDEEQQFIIHQACRRLPPEAVMLLDLRYRQDCDFATIGRLLGITEQAARVRHFRLIQQLGNDRSIQALGGDRG